MSHCRFTSTAKLNGYPNRENQGVCDIYPTKFAKLVESIWYKPATVRCWSSSDITEEARAADIGRTWRSAWGYRWSGAAAAG